MRVGDPAPRGLRPSALTPEPVHSIRQRPGGQQPRHSLTSGEEKNSAKHRRPNPALVELGGISTDRCASCRSRCAPQRLRSAAACSPTPPAVAAVAGGAAAQGDPAEGRGGRRDPRSTRGPTRVPLRRPRSAWLCARRPAGGPRGPGCVPGLGVRRQLSETGTGGRGRLGIRSPGLLFLSWGPGQVASSLCASVSSWGQQSVKWALAQGRQQDWGVRCCGLGCSCSGSPGFLGAPRVPHFRGEQSAEPRKDLHPLVHGDPSPPSRGAGGAL